MDIGAMGFEFEFDSPLPPIMVENAGTNRYAGSGFFRPVNGNEKDDEARDCKVARHHHSHMLSFSSPNASQADAAATFPYYHPSSTPFTRNTGYGSTVVRGPFTPSQWMELEHQALIYKYITSNVPIPSSLLNPIRRAFHSVAFPSLVTSNALGWGAFHLGFSSTDPEPGRCRRTDGKKWRCSRDAVADQKYCEPHINRGRHRSRKPVEGQSGNSATGKPSAAAPSVLPLPAGTNRMISSHLSKGSADQEAAVQPIMSSEAGLKGNGYKYHHSSSGVQPERAQLSIFIPPATSDNLAGLPPRLPHELEMGLGVGTAAASTSHPISWEPSMGGPLGEALHATTGQCSIIKPLNLMDGWDNIPRLAASSPTGVLQRGCLSNSSTASSPRAVDAGGLILMNPSLPQTD